MEDNMTFLVVKTLRQSIVQDCSEPLVTSLYYLFIIKDNIII